MKNPRLSIMFLLVLFVLMLTACTRNESASNTSTGLRIVTLGPTLTEMVIDMGLEDSLVGVTEQDVVAPKKLPVVGTFFKVDTETLLSLRPTHVFVLTGKDGPPAHLVELANKGSFKLFAYPYPKTIDDVMQLLDSNTPEISIASPDQQVFYGSSVPGMGQALDRVQHASSLKVAVYNRLDQIRQLTKSLNHPKSLLLFSLKEPVMASGPGSVNDQLLEIAGGVNAAGSAAIDAPTFDRESLISMSPDFIFALLPEAPAQKTNDPRIAALRSLPIPAAQNNHIYILNDKLILIPGISMYKPAAQLASLLHPNLKPQMDQIIALPLLPASTPVQSH